MFWPQKSLPIKKTHIYTLWKWCNGWTWKSSIWFDWWEKRGYKKESEIRNTPAINNYIACFKITFIIKQEVPVSIPSIWTLKIFLSELGCNKDHPPFCRQLDSYLINKYQVSLKKSILNALDGSYCYLIILPFVNQS